jgi:prophage tail gpP-like protein
MSVEFRVNGLSYADFKRASIYFSMEDFARSFTLEFSDTWLGTLEGLPPFDEMDLCQVFVYGEKVIDGFIDEIPVDYDEKAHSIQVTGRSLTGDLVDCSAIYQAGAWYGKSLSTIASNLCDDYGISVKVDPQAAAAASEPFKKWAIEDEETVYDCIQRAAKIRGLWLLSDGGRNLVITKTSKVLNNDALKLGVNVKRGQRWGSQSERYSEYTVKSQNAGDDTYYADDATGPFFKIKDPKVKRHRPLIMISDGSGTKAELQARGTWERNKRAGAGRITYVTPSFRNSINKLWPANQMIHVEDSFLGINEPLLMASLAFTYDDDSSGESTRIELVRPETFDIYTPPPKAKKKGKL